MTGYRYTGERLSPQDMKAKMGTERNKMREQEPDVRNKNFEEVNLGYTEEMAITEAQRCMLCVTAPCVRGCPVNIKIPEFIKKIAEGDFDAALDIMKSDNVLPAITGRVCPQEEQCEGPCTQSKASKCPVAIGHLERFIADRERKSGARVCFDCKPPNGRKVAIIGSGPGGLTVAADMAREGYDVHVFEAFHKTGGVLVYGIPEFRLPKEIVQYEIEGLEEAGVKIHTNHVIGRIFTVNQLMEEKDFEAVFIAIGAGLPKFMNIEGENLNGVYSANEYLTRSNLMKAYDFPNYDTPILKGKNVAVVGGGNVAMDSVRTAKRLGAEHAYLIYRRAREQMPARDEEIMHAEEEGIEFHLLCNPVKYIGDDKGWIKKVECVKMELGEPDDSGRRRPVVIKDSNYTMDIDVAVVAVGTDANPLIKQTTPGMDFNRWGNIVVDEKFRTSKKGVFAGGDIVRGAATVILAMGDGRNAAAAMLEYLEKKEWYDEFKPAEFW